MTLEKITQNPFIHMGDRIIKVEIDPRYRQGSNSIADQIIISDVATKKTLNTIIPHDYATEPFFPASELLRVGVVQILPGVETNKITSYKLIVGTDNTCCDGAVSYFELQLSPDEASSRLIKGVFVPFNVHGILGSDRPIYSSKNWVEGGAIVYGFGCSGSGIRLIDFSLGDSREIIPTSESDYTMNLRTYVTLYNKPEVKEGHLIIPAYQGPGFTEKWTNGREIDIEQELLRKLPDDFTEKSILPKIRNSVAESRFVYREPRSPLK